jgi:hypothetical protein
MKLYERYEYMINITLRLSFIKIHLYLEFGQDRTNIGLHLY